MSKLTDNIRRLVDCIDAAEEVGENTMGITGKEKQEIAVNKWLLLIEPLELPENLKNILLNAHIIRWVLKITVSICNALNGKLSFNNLLAYIIPVKEEE